MTRFAESGFVRKPNRYVSFGKIKAEKRQKINLIFSCHNRERKRPAFEERRRAGGGDSDSRLTVKAFDAETSVSSTIRDGKPSGLRSGSLPRLGKAADFHGVCNFIWTFI